MLTNDAILMKINENLAKIKQFGVQDLALFGSFARNEGELHSDIDVLVEFAEGKKSFDNFMDLKFFLEDLLGHRIDLVTKDALKPELEPHITRSLSHVKGL